MKLHRLALVLILPLLLSGCFLAPGIFTAALDLQHDGGFTFAYKGEVVFLNPEEMGGKDEFKPKPWADSMAICSKTEEPRYDEYAGEFGVDDAADKNKRPCTAAEIATLKQKHSVAQAERLERDKKEAAQMAAVFGFNPMDEEANAKIASTLMRYEGWRSVSYRGKGVYDVDYQIAGKIGHDFVFPMFPQGDIMIPFVTIRGLDRGSVRINAPALIGGGFKGMAAQMKAMGMPAEKDMPTTFKRTKGTFTVTTAGEILTNNTENGATVVGNARRLVWEIDATTEKIPEALIKLR